MRQCKVCGVTKSLDEFYKISKSSSHFPECKPCNRAKAREWSRAKRATDPTYARASHLRNIYGISIDEYDRMLAAQDGLCVICGTSEPGGRGKRFHVDHDHDTGVIRGLLCHSCNVGVGNLGESPDRLLAAAAYLLTSRNVLASVVF